MKIFKESENSHLFQLHGLTEEQIIAENDIHSNYRAYLEELVKCNDKLLISATRNTNVEKTREVLKLQIATCKEYEKAFAEVLNISKKSEMN